MKELKWKRIVFDEMHCLNNPKSKRGKSALQLSADLRIGLTGSPTNNSMAELKHLLAVLDAASGVLSLRSLPQFSLRRLKTDTNPDTQLSLMGNVPGVFLCKK